MVVLRPPSPAGMRWLVLALTLGTARAFTPRADLRLNRFTLATTMPLVARRPVCSEHNVPGFFSSIFGPLVTGTPESGRTVTEEFSHGLNESSRTFAEVFTHGLTEPSRLQGSEAAGIFTRGLVGTPESGRTVAEELSHGLNESSRTFAERLTEPSRLQGSEAAGIVTRSATGMGLILIALGHPMGGLDPGLARSAVRLVLGSLGSYRVVCKASAPLPPPSLAPRPFPRPSRSPALLPSRSTPFLLPSRSTPTPRPSPPALLPTPLTSPNPLVTGPSTPTTPPRSPHCSLVRSKA